jgi:hypothetical protein
LKPKHPDTDDHLAALIGSRQLFTPDPEDAFMSARIFHTATASGSVAVPLPLNCSTGA